MCRRPTRSILQEPDYRAKNVVAVLPTNSLIHSMPHWFSCLNSSSILTSCMMWTLEFQYCNEDMRKISVWSLVLVQCLPATRDGLYLKQPLFVFLSSHVRYMVTMMIDSFCGWACGESFFYVHRRSWRIKHNPDYQATQERHGITY